MTIYSLRPMTRPDNLQNQVRASQSLARKLYLGALLGLAGWIAMMVFGPMLFLNADGLVVSSDQVIAPPYAAQVVNLSIRSGDPVAAGQKIATVVSTQMLTLISDLSARKAQTDARAAEIVAQLSAITDTLPIAQQRAAAAEKTAATVARAMTLGFSTNARVEEIARERYDSAHELATLQAQRIALAGERQALVADRQRLDEALNTAEQTYRDGVIASPVAGVVGPSVATAGSVLTSNDRITEIYFGTQYVLAYLPTNRFYSVRPNQEVVVTDGARRTTGRVEGIERVEAQLPGEFQSSFQSVERQQVARIALSDASAFSLLSKIKVTSEASPSNLFALGRAAVIAVAWRLFEPSIAHAQPAKGGGP